MIPAAFDYVRAESLEHARALLEQHGEEAKILAGGHSLIPMMKLRLATPPIVIDIAHIPGLAALAATGDPIAIGALTRHATIAASDDLAKHAPALHDAANEVGDQQVRNRGTIGGSCAHGDPSADYPAVMLALDAAFTLQGDGKREVRADEFFQGMFTTSLAWNELLTTVSFARAPHSAYVKLHHPASHYAVVGAAAKLTLAGDTIKEARVAITGAGDYAFRARGVEQALAGKKISDQEALRQACEGAATGADVRADHYAPARYRAAMADVFAYRAVEKAIAR
jgi:carbon-monoxide dehydrogenase medium subunit